MRKLFWEEGSPSRKPGDYNPPKLFNEMADAGIQNFASMDEIPLSELRYLQRQILSTGLAATLYSRYQEQAVQDPDSVDTFNVIIDVVPSSQKLTGDMPLQVVLDEAPIFSEEDEEIIRDDEILQEIGDYTPVPEERSVIEAETADAYVVCEGYARYALQMECTKKTVLYGAAQRPRVLNNITSLRIIDKEDSRNLISFYLREDEPGGLENLEIEMILSEWEENRRPATPLQKILLAKMIETLLDPQEA